MDTEFSGKVVVITGAGSGIGRATALRFAETGAMVFVADINEVGGRETVTQITAQSGMAKFVQTDVSDAESVNALMEAALTHSGRLDVGVNNAGIGGGWAKTADYPHQDWHRVLAVNLTGVFYCMQTQLKQMLVQGSGAIINTASIAGVRALDNAPAYTASKHGVIGLTKAAAREYARNNIRINAVCPVFTRTPLFEETLNQREDYEERLTRLIPMRRFGRAEDIADAIFWLVSDQAGFVTGQALQLDGGMTA
ncbi:glucose 1-dehydrogenase [Chloroflexi bacterium TSY]|nr:glucose 1-dehydrogenase [Chloroflexi bacterium TSY]MBV7331976.1 glucose 1-dehydrogenase [Chloroflexi bacterium TSY]